MEKTPDMLIKNAAKGMYHAKSNGRNNFELFYEGLSSSKSIEKNGSRK